MMRSRTFGRDLWASWLGLIVVLLIWQLVATFELVNPSVFPGPLEIVNVALYRFSFAEMLGHIRWSLTRVILGFAIGTPLAILLGIATGWYRWLGKIVWSPLELLRPIPPLAWIPFALIWFGLGEESKVFIIVLAAFFPVITNTYKGMTTIDPQIMRAAQTMGVKGLPLLFQVAIPAALPDIAVGMRVGISLSFGSLVAAEILAAEQGLGFMIMYGRQVGEVGMIIYGIIVIGVLNLLIDYLFHEIVIKRQLRWHFSTDASE